MLDRTNPTVPPMSHFARNHKPLACAAAVLALVLGWSSSATAQEDDLLRPSERPMFATFGLGPALGITGCGSGGCSSAASFTQFKLIQEFGYHFSGTGEGPALGVSIAEAFGDNVYRFQPGAKFWWDIKPSDEISLYVTPSAKLGYGLFTATSGSASLHTLNVQIGTAARMVFDDRWMAFFRPITLDTFANDDGIAFSWDVIAGGGVTF